MTTMTIDTVDLYRRATDEFGARVRLVADRWSEATPCADWDVRALVRHIAEEERWAPPLFAGLTIADVGDSLAGDLLGDDPAKGVRRRRQGGAGRRRRSGRPRDRPLLGSRPTSRRTGKPASSALGSTSHLMRRPRTSCSPCSGGRRERLVTESLGQGLSHQPQPFEGGVCRAEHRDVTVVLAQPQLS
jgi:hypothetical protein